MKNPESLPLRPPLAETLREPWWKMFKNPIALEENRQLTDEQRRRVEMVSDLLVKDVLDWAVPAAKPLAAKAPYPGGVYDHTSFFIKGSTRAWEDLTRALNTITPKTVIRCMNSDFDSEGKGISGVLCMPHPSDPTKILLQIKLETPPGTIDYDKARVSQHNHALIIQNGEFFKEFKKMDSLRLLPFILKATALKIAPNRAVYFDGSIAGCRGTYKPENDNRVRVLLVEQQMWCDVTRAADPNSKVTFHQTSETVRPIDLVTTFTSGSLSPNTTAELNLFVGGFRDAGNITY